MECRKCGIENDKPNLTCTNCGASLKGSIVSRICNVLISPYFLGLVVLVVVGVILWHPFTTDTDIHKVSPVKANMRSMAVAIEAYFIDYGEYPGFATGASSANGPVATTAPSYGVTSFRVWSSPQEFGTFCTLTTPIAYITHYLRDPFAHQEQGVGTFAYYKDDKGWILISPGPDHVFDIDPKTLYDSSIPQPSVELLLKAYDATNGALSEGDIFRVKQ